MDPYRVGRLRDFIERLPCLPQRRALALVLALALSGLAWGLRAALDPWFPPGFPYLTFFPAVVLSTFLFGLGPGAAAAVACGLAARYGFIEPVGSLTLTRDNALAVAFYVGVVTVDVALIHWMQSANARLRAERERSLALSEERRRLVERSELLFDELQHRVSNNLQMVGALLSLQQRSVRDPGARAALAQAGARLGLIGRLQRSLYGASGALTEFEAYLAALVGDVLAASGKPGLRQSLRVEGDLRLPPPAAIPVALIVAEALANAVEHGFAGRDEGRIEVEARRRGDELDISVRDDGCGLPEGFDLAKADSLGLRIMRTLAQQAGGQVALVPATPGVRMELTIPLTV